jgi:MFS family permease
MRRDAEPSAQPEPAPRPSVVPGVERNVFILGVVSFFTDISSEAVYPLVPIFLTKTLGAPLAVVGAIEGLAESTAAGLRWPAGWLSDRLGRRKPFVVLGYGMAALAKPLLALAFHWPVVLFARFVDRFGKGVRTAPRDALVAQWTEREVRGRAFGFHRAVDTAGAVLGPLGALALLAILGENFRLIFLLAFIPAVLGMVLLRLVGERTSQPRAAPTPVGESKGGGLRFGAAYYAFFIVSLVFALGNSSDAFLILRSRNLGLGVSEAVLAYVAYNASYSLLAMPAGIASDRLGRRSVIGLGFAIFAAVYLGFALIDAGAYVWLLFPVYGVYMALTEGVGRALVADLVPGERRGSALGLYQGGVGLMALLSSILAGLLWDHVGVSAPFYLGGSTAALALVLLLVFLPRGSKAAP